MKDRVITFSIADNFIRELGSYVESNYIKKGADLSRLAFVFGGHRPSLFLNRELSQRLGKTFFPPSYFAMDGFVRLVLEKKHKLTQVSDIDACYIVYKKARELAPELLRNRETFARFLPWAYEICSFIEQLDLEDIPEGPLNNVQDNAAIGYDVPESINRLLSHAANLRSAFHKELKERGEYTRGLMYLLASDAVKDADFGEFDDIFFCSFFFLHKTERAVLKALHDRKKAVLVFQGDENQWPVLKELAETLSSHICPSPLSSPAGGEETTAFVPSPLAGEGRVRGKLHLYSGFDTHSQASVVREIVGKLDSPGNSVLVMPDPEAVVPLLAEVAPVLDEFNVSLGYPLKRSSLYSLLQDIFAAQATHSGGRYYAKDYLKALSHPLIKNARFGASPEVTRIITHKAEELLAGVQRSPLAGSLFVRLKDIENNPAFVDSVQETLAGLDTSLPDANIVQALSKLHELMFGMWEEISTFKTLAAALEKLLDYLLENSFLTSYPLNTKSAERLLNIAGEFNTAAFSRESFPKDELFRIIEERMEKARVSFTGSPLKGMQILGALESRSLSFENVIIMDMNESVFPSLSVHNALIPRDVMLGLGLNRFEKEEEIMRYHFMRLIAPAENVHLVYSESAKTARSRFIEELVWERQKSGNPSLMPSHRRIHIESAKLMGKQQEARKTPEVMEHLKDFRFSPSSIDTYLACPKKFYFSYVLNLREKEEVSDEPENRDIGTFLHDVLNLGFSRFAGKKPVIDAGFKEHFSKLLDNKFDEYFTNRMKSDSFLLKEVITHRMERFLSFEAARSLDVREVAALERKFYNTLSLGGRNYNISARIDRIDRLEDGTLLILDYKTGGGVVPGKLERLSAMAENISREAVKRAVSSFQLPIYVDIAAKEYKEKKIDAGLYNLREIKFEKYFKEDDDASRAARTELCFKALEFIMDELHDPDKMFVPDDTNADYCNACPFFYACR